MEYILQVFAGGWHTQSYTADDIMTRLNTIIDAIPVRAVLIGWNLNAGLYRTVGDFLHSRSIDMILWLPVFSETGELLPSEEALDINGKPVGSLALQEGENFAFSCPLSTQNVQQIYETYFSDCGFDGVFLDKIRTQSFVGGISGVLSCGCPACQKAYAEHGLSLSRVSSAYAEKGDAFLETSGYVPGTGFTFTDPLAEQFFALKGTLIAESVTRLCRYFHDRGLTVGLDLYAPLLSRFVGQSYREISCEADFIKPMLYRKTEAPAGIGYEYRLLRQSLPHARNYPEINTDDRFLEAQLQEFRDLPCRKYPGIEVNYREDIARTDPAYIRTSMKILEAGGMDGAVLAWDVMLAPDEHIRAVKE
ncbi:MAG: hypothetical protein Q4D46_09415 [Erysipelotrichaceae bacterium]|nr:hypothetical protein [Erysipelotrichaceae bacterium]